MAQTEWRWRHLAAVAALAAGSATVVSLAQSSADIWWTGYGNGPDNSRYLPSRQIDKSNVTGFRSPGPIRSAIPAAARSSSAALPTGAAGTDRSSPWMRAPARSCGFAKT